VSDRLVTALRAFVVVAGIAVTVAGALAMRVEDWPIYVVFVALALVLFGPAVEVVPGLTLPMPGLALCLGFLYVGGLPIVFLRNLAPPFLIQLLRWAVPPRWRGELVGPRWGRGPALPLLWGTDDRDRPGVAADWAAFSLGLGVRWGIVSLLVGDGRPAAHPGAIVVAEAGGYACWALLSALPVLSFRAFRWTAPEEPVRAVSRDLGLVMIVALTPFVLLVAYGYEVSGLTGAAAWSIAALGLHFMLQRLNERRLTVEEQNRRLEALNRELEHRERLSAIGKMSSVVSHQMLQQLGIIRLHADLIRNADRTGDLATTVAQATEHAHRIEDALDGVNRVLTDLLVFSRDFRLNPYEHALDRVLAECVEESLPHASARGVVLRLACPPGLTVTFDKLKVKQAVVNLIRNAIEASPTGAEVWIEALPHDGGAEVAVRDRGPGVPESDREAIFSPFFTTKETGTGLGLAIAREFVAAHGGTIAVEAAEGGGSRFVVRLPPRPLGADAVGADAVPTRATVRVGTDR
jgi:signal transduction histidine kinase